MVRLVPFAASDALEDAIRLKRKCNLLEDEIDELKTLLKSKTLDPAYRQCLHFLLTNTEKFKLPKRRRRVCSNVVNEVGDCDGEIDPQYGLFLSSLKKHETSYVLEGKINDAPTFIKYEGESSLKNAIEHEGGRKTRSAVERIKMLSNKNPGLANDQDPVNQHASDMKVQPGNKSSEQSPSKLVNLVKRKNSNEEANELSNQKTDLRTNGLSQNQHGDDVQAPSNRMNDEISRKKSKNTTVVQANNGVTEKQNKPGDQDQMDKKYEVQIRKILRKLVKRDPVTNSESALKIGHLHQMPSPMNDLVRGNQSKQVDQARPREKEHGTVQRQARKAATAKNVFEREYEASQIAKIIIENQIPVPRKNLVTKCQSESLDQIITGNSKHEVRLKGYEAGRESVIQHQKPVLKKVRVTEYQCEDVDQAQPVTKDIVQSQRKLRKVVRWKNEVRVENEANKNDKVWKDIEHVHYKPCTRNNRVAENHCESVDRSQPIREDEVRIQKKLKKTNQEENWVETENGLSNPKIAFGNNCAAKQDETQAQRGRKSICLKLNQVKEDEDESDPDIEILDKDTFLNNTGNMWNRGDAPHLKSGCLCDEFRRQVMNALKKPFDQQEYTMYLEAVEAGSYFKYHPDLEEKLKKYHCEKGKCLAILRGFFFWLEHLTQVGSFEPWTDKECLEVDSKAY